MSEYLDRKQVIELFEKHQSHLATYVWEFGQELKALPTITIPTAELDTTNEERPRGEFRDRLKEVFQEASEIGSDLFHLSQIERIIDGEDWL